MKVGQLGTDTFTGHFVLFEPTQCWNEDLGPETTDALAAICSLGVEYDTRFHHEQKIPPGVVYFDACYLNTGGKDRFSVNSVMQKLDL